MPRKARVKSKTGIYHIMWRGANRQEIFHDDDDWVKFLDILQKYKVKCELTVYAWCLMNNHVHLLIKEGNEDMSITLKRIGVSYVGYYNWKYRTTGHLFQDRFKSECVENNKYLLTVVRYIHQNPVKAGMVSKADEWRWSSCCGYYGKSSYPKNMLDSEYILRIFSADTAIALVGFKEFNERKNNDNCLDESVYKKRISDEEARVEIKKMLGEIEIAQVKSLPKVKRNEILRKVKEIDGLSLRQAARIFGVSLGLMFKA
ncbi:transposase [Heyndrickxia camelliae]|uniref:Transposase n=1 Tax=Heyndrickxia camelliae TaxID=1707093 RepID=A0A2N3LPA4_9BACI|nr:transposase [Heyndrickxia camelliae]PKR86440.1 transposase [Heyndrickxia camelliae]